MEYHQIPRNSCHSTDGISTRQAVSAKFPWDGQFPEQILHDSQNILPLSDNCVDYMLIINQNWSITNLSIP